MAIFLRYSIFLENFYYIYISILFIYIVIYFAMSTDQLISVSELKNNYVWVLKSLSFWPKFILNDNKAEAVLLSADEYKHIQNLLKVKDRNDEVEDALKHWKSYNNFDDLLSDLDD